MRALFIQHDHASPVSHIGAQFEARGFEVQELLIVPEDRFHDPGVTATFPPPTAYDVLVPMGAPWSVYDEVTIGAWVLEELTLLRAAHAAGVPILGICFGGQALAAALGGSVVRAERPEIGWYPISTDEPGLVDPGPWFEWHHDQWVAPPGARVVARTPDAEQAFVVGRSLAVQFHPELTASTLQGWLENGGRGYLEANGEDADELLGETLHREAEAAARGRRLVDRFLDTVAFADDDDTRAADPCGS
jgi:GMP synthase-like glutamine amidotransferase